MSQEGGPIVAPLTLPGVPLPQKASAAVVA